MLKERNIAERWVRSVMDNPIRREQAEDGTVHFLGFIEEHGNRCLRVVVNPRADPPRIVTLLFDRRIGRTP